METDYLDADLLPTALPAVDDDTSNLSPSAAPDIALSVSSGDSAGATYYTNPEYEASVISSLEAVQLQQDALLASSQRLEAQNEAIISIMLIFIVGVVFNYIYKFLKMFF